MTCLLLGSLACASTAPAKDPLFAKGLKRKNDQAWESKTNLLTNRRARNDDGTINVVVEIPAGTDAKWEVSEDGTQLVWQNDRNTGKPRRIDYLPYPGNYGMVSRTWLDPAQGGDGQALDVMVLGTTVPRGSVIKATPIGVVRVVDRFEQDDKILAIEAGSHFEGVTDLESLDAEYPGVSDILKIWFGNVHRTNDVQMMGAGSRAQANAVIDFAADAFTKKRTREKAAQSQ
jgi:inorganic pyrophosphatase